MAFKRARDEKQIETRKKDILHQARLLCNEQGALNWSLNELGRRASVNKSNLYRYFGSKEEILMQLMQIEMHQFIDSSLIILNEKPMALASLAKMLAKQFTAQPFLCELISVSTSLLEKNVDIERIKQFKIETNGLYQTLSDAIANSVEEIEIEQSLKISMTAGVMVSGLWPLANPNDNIQALTQEAEFAWLKIEFEAQLQDMLNHYVMGLLAVTKSV